MLEIKVRQNEEDILKKQFVAGWFYDIAEVIEIVSFVACSINVLLSYLFAETSWIIYVVTLLLFSEGICDYLKLHLINKGAKIRNNTDRLLLFGISYDSGMDSYDNAKLMERVDRICYKHKKRFEKKKSRDGFKKGIKDWYILDDKSTDDLWCIYNCQKQNGIFDKQITFWNKLFLLLALIIIASIIFSSRNGLLLFCVSLPLISKIIKSCVLMIRHNNIIVSMKVICSQVDKGDISKEKLEELQSYIEKRRCMDFSTFSVVYNLYRKYLHRITERAVNTKKSI